MSYRYVIMAAGNGTRWNNHLGVPKHLVEINGETLLARTTRLLKENGIKNYVITGFDERYSQYGKLVPQTNTDCEIDRFEESVIDGPVCYLYGDVYYTEEAMKTIVSTNTRNILFFGSTYEIFAIKVNNISLFLKHKHIIKNLYLNKKIDRCIGWEIYRSLQKLPLNEHKIIKDFVIISDDTDDIDYPTDYLKFKAIRENKEQSVLDLIIPCHNLEQWIKPCLESLCIQKNNLQMKRRIIFICDNCTDNTHQIIEDRMKQSDWDYEIYDAHEGSPGGARNVGLEHSNSKYIWFIDGDDWLVGEDAIDTVLDCMLRDDMDIVQFKIRSNVNPLGAFGGGTVWTAMFSRRLIGDYRFNNKQNGEDNDFCEEMWNRRNPKFGKIALAPYFYNYPRLNSLSDIAYQCYSKQKAVFVISCTRNYYQYLYTFLSSLTKNNFYKKIYLIIEDNELNLPFTNIEYININNIPLNKEGVNYNTGYSKASLTRLYLADLISEDIVLYLDTDLLVVDNITELFDIDLKDYYMAAVIDQGAKTNLMTPDLPIDKNYYINSGVILFNLKKIREDNKIKELDKFVNNHNLFYPDQDTLNVVFKDNIKFLDNKYNSSLFTGVADKFKIYHWAGNKSNWVYNREYCELWKDEEFRLKDSDFKLEVK